MKKNFEESKYEDRGKTMIRLKNEKHEEKFKILVIIALLSISCYLAFSFYFILRINIIFSHFFYFPIVLACFWWKKKGLIVPIFLSGLLFFFPFFFEPNIINIENLDIFFRAIILTFIGIATTILSEHVSKMEEKLRERDKYLEQKIKERTIELKESEVKYHKAYDRADFYKDLFAHDMNNILQNILSSIELVSLFLNNEKKKNKIKNILEISKEQVKRGGNLILNVQKLSQLEKIDVLTQPTEILTNLKETIKYLPKKFQEKEINIKVESHGEKFFVQANELLIDIFENVINNALKYNNNSIVKIIIRISRLQKRDINHVKIEFIDNGIGIPDNKKKVVFKRENKTHRALKGIGLGLSLVKKILKAYNGKIWVEDKVPGDYSKGSRFIIIIPECV
ncbi:MAG: sensor histidine kinase [Promethearchaeota archaeon]